MVGGLVSTTVTTWVQELVWPWQSTAFQLRLTVQGQPPLVWDEPRVGTSIELQQLSQAQGGTGTHASHRTVWLVQLSVGGGHWEVPVVSAKARSRLQKFCWGPVNFCQSPDPPGLKTAKSLKWLVEVFQPHESPNWDIALTASQ